MILGSGASMLVEQLHQLLASLLDEEQITQEGALRVFTLLNKELH